MSLLGHVLGTVAGVVVGVAFLALVWVGWMRFIDWIGPRVGDDDF